MTTTAAGDAAVARLNKATEAFEKIITGASNQVVDVPGYGNQPTLAARVDERLDETTATAAAEADRSRTEADRATTQATAAANSVTLATAEYNKAKTQADRAQDEADRAAQITGLETVADAIGMAALPLPDVWAPLSDSLRMITGYGRDVLVGSDVVARMVNFSRSTTATYIDKGGQLKTAAVNEPRFEKEGLLIEGQSSNLIPTSTSFQAALPGVTYEQAANPAFPHPIIRVIKPSGDGDVRTINAELIAGTVYTASMYFDKNATPSAMVFYGGSSIAATMVRSGVVVGGLERYTATFTCQVSGTHQIIFGSYGAAFDFVAGCPQIEPLPFASSYIPTNGAAATRVADRAYILWGQNMPLSVADAVSFAVEATPYKSPAPDSRTILDLGISSASLSIRGDNAIAYISINAKSSRVDLNPNEVTYRIVARYDGSFVTAGNNGVIGTPTAYTADGDRPSTRYMRIGSWKVGDTGWETAQYGTYRCMWGHIRNIRIWHSALTDEQIKAIR